ncbi:unnamed protein product, partial [Allacma fusca]
PSLPPEKISCTATSSESLQITWDDPGLEGRHGIIQGYKVMHQVSDSVSDSNGLTLPNSQESEEFPVETKLTTSKTTGLHGLRPWTNYSVSVLAFTAMGDGKLSQPILCQTEEDGVYLSLLLYVVFFTLSSSSYFPLYDIFFPPYFFLLRILLLTK